MNSDQLQDWLTDLNERWKEHQAMQGAMQDHALLSAETGKTHCLIKYLNNNYADVDLTQPIFAQLLSSYYRGGVLRYFVLQCVPSLIYIYLLALAKQQRKSVSVLETIFLAMYNEEILSSGVNSSSPVKKIEEVRIPSIHFPSVYHDPKKLNLAPGIVPPKSNPSSFVQMTVRIGPYKSIDRIIAENRQSVLTRLLKSVNACLCQLSGDIVCRYMCLCTTALCKNGFCFPESNLKSKIFGDSLTSEISDDFSRRPRLQTSSHYLLEVLNGLYFALYNGSLELAVEALDAVHHRALYEFYSDVILVTNSMRESLLSSDFSKGDLMAIHRKESTRADSRKRSEIVTNASLRLRKMPEDIPFVVENETKGSHFSDSVENFKKRIATKVEHHRFKHFGHHRRKSEGFAENSKEFELLPINEESKTVGLFADQLANLSTSEKLGQSSSSGNTTHFVHSPRTPAVSEGAVENGTTRSENEAVVDLACREKDATSGGVVMLRDEAVSDSSSKHLHLRHMDSLGDSIDVDSTLT